MAEQQQNANGEEKKKFPLKTIIVLVAVFLIEAVVIAAVFMLSGGPEPAKAQGAEEDLKAKAQEPVEVLVVEGKFINSKSGRTYVYEAQVFVVVKRKHEEQTITDVKNMQAQIANDVRTVIARAEPAQLAEESLSTIIRHIQQQLEERLGKDEEGNSIVQEVVIGSWTRFRADM